MKKAYFYSEGDGMYATGCKTPEEALKAMRKHYLEWDETPELVAEQYGFDLDRLVLENITVERAYYHRTCGFTTVGDSLCIECGEQMRGHGKDVFAINV